MNKIPNTTVFAKKELTTFTGFSKKANLAQPGNKISSIDTNHLESLVGNSEYELYKRDVLDKSKFYATILDINSNHVNCLIGRGFLNGNFDNQNKLLSTQ